MDDQPETPVVKEAEARPVRPVRRRVVKRLLRGVVVYGLLGLVLSVLVAWGLAAWVPVQYGVEVDRSESFRSYSSVSGNPSVVSTTAYGLAEMELRHFGAVRRSWHGHGDILLGLRFVSDSPLAQDTWDLKSSAIVAWAWHVQERQSWGRLPRLEDIDENTYHTFSGIEDARGWPALCLWMQIEHGPSTQGPFHPFGSSTGNRDVRARGAVPLGHHGANLNSATVVGLPYRPIWSGLAVNTAFYALLWFGMIRIPRALRRHRRMFRGRCPRCGYDLKGVFTSPCSECGWTIAARRKPAKAGAA